MFYFYLYNTPQTLEMNEFNNFHQLHPYPVILGRLNRCLRKSQGLAVIILYPGISIICDQLHHVASVSGLQPTPTKAETCTLPCLRF
jgi:hypothetical protein